jgi:hypothetical protein
MRDFSSSLYWRDCHEFIKRFQKKVQKRLFCFSCRHLSSWLVRLSFVKGIVTRS